MKHKAWGPNTIAWARLWVEHGAPEDLSGPPWCQEHFTITEKLSTFRKAYRAATDEERTALCENLNHSVADAR